MQSRTHRRALLVLALAALWLVACGEDTPEQLFAAADAAARRAASDTSAVSEAVAQMEAFLAAHPAHAKAPEALKALAMLTQQRGQMRAAIAQYERLLREYPASDCAVEAQFLIGFVYEEHLQDFTRAREAYEAVIEKYPDSELAANARRLLPHVGRPPEEWVEFQEGAG